MYARVMAAHGPAVDRRTPNYKTLAGLKRGIRREYKRLPGVGPFIVSVYKADEPVTSYTEG